MLIDRLENFLGEAYTLSLLERRMGWMVEIHDVASGEHILGCSKLHGFNFIIFFLKIFSKCNFDDENHLRKFLNGLVKFG